MLPEIATDFEDVYITADTHFSHGNMIKFTHRPFLSLADQIVLAKNGGRWHDGSWKGPRGVKYKISPESIEIMDSSIINNINKIVPENAKLIHLGDFSLAPKDEADLPAYIKRCETIRSRINCRNLSIIWGNHDSPDHIKHLFQWSGWMAKVKLTKHDIIMVLCHYANAVWDESHRGALHCYGHSHAEIEPYIQQAMPGCRSMDVGIDNAIKVLGEYRPFKLQEITDILMDKPGHNFNPMAPTNSKAPRGSA